MVAQLVVLASVVALVPEVECLWQVGHASTCYSMSLLMPGQYTHCLALYWHFDVPECP